MKDILTIKIIDGILTISIGADALAFAFEQSPENYNPDKDTSIFKVSDKTQFMNDVLIELMQEQEDGTTLVHEMFGKAMENVLEMGSTGIEG